jgi:xylan 1,4-beta-xylosidase
MLRFTLLVLLHIIVGSAAVAQGGGVEFLWARYDSSDPEESQPKLRNDEFRNPVIPGFQPDPSILRVGNDFYVVNSSFGWFPGLPIYHSRDLVNWQQVGNAITDIATFNLPAVGINRGIFAPTIRWHKGNFYIVTTCIECGNNFIITAKNVKGPWSKPVWLPTVTGIDPDLFLDDDGRVWITNNDEPNGSAAYDGHRALWIQEYDPTKREMVGLRKLLVDRGASPAERPIWTEGPHIYKINGWYYLTAAEGGTSDDHRQTIYRSKSVTGPYVAGPNNPILTQRDLDPSRASPVYATGHADFVQLPNGDWWTTFLATRPYEGNLTNLGRETFLLPVKWSDGWPGILAKGKPVPLRLKKPALPPAGRRSDWSTWQDSFEQSTLGPQWLSRKAPASNWMSVTQRPGSLVMHGNGAHFVGQRQRHRNAAFSTEIRLPVSSSFDRAGLAAIADEDQQFFFGIERRAAGTMLVVTAKGRKGTAGKEQFLVEVPFDLAANMPIRLRINMRGKLADFAYAARQGEWNTILTGADARILATEYDGLLFTGTVIGLYASSSPS